MAVIAKFTILSKTKEQGFDPIEKVAAPQYSIKGSAVYDGEGENEKFFQATPYGSIELGVLNKAAADQLEPGDEVYVTIEKCQK